MINPFVTKGYAGPAYFCDRVKETKDMVQYRLKEGCRVVEMECAALAACSRKRGAKFGQFLFTGDSLANVHEYDARDFGCDSHAKALQIGLDILATWED